MTAPAPAWIERYPHDRALRRRAEVGFWAVVLLVQAAFNTVVTWIDLRGSGRSVAAWEPLLWELSSVAVVAALIPAVVAFERRFVLRRGTLRRHLPWHVLASVVYCTVHLAGMWALRHAGYAALGEHYQPPSWWTQWGYEYLKDVRSYALTVGALVSYRFLLLRLQGEARVLDAPEPPAEPEPPLHAPGAPGAATATQAPASTPEAPAAPPPQRPERFLVRKLRREFLIAAGDIAWLQAEANYVGLHVNGHDYLLRSTLTDFLTQLDPTRFVRVHRSYAVNLDAIAEIEPLDSGDARLVMKDGSSVPCSRRYRDGLVTTAR
ncbi:LytTR family DNA-binding domain-containing protein [Acidovorax sp. ACV01]|uniref:LytTR family DNA-binding domain-containing protein n=1 Tax=Acidovorax sp. ACV01 TaxID=2769311 RepID=UPI001782AF72|nr:LytTR family DNA-binding domain-containing protein [Acidovorax sp. ACV01]MBD9392499.1 LytTR family transcriptional regulator [Acidovorax sp. ACV01]